jgi:hypothetical protein
MAFGIKTIALKIRDNKRKPKEERIACPDELLEAKNEALHNREKAERFELQEALQEFDEG